MCVCDDHLSIVHVGLNLIYLVPGETGGMEVAARELIPALVAAAPGVRFTAFINREAAAAGRRASADNGTAHGQGAELQSGSACASYSRGQLSTVTVPVNARERLQWVGGEQALLPRLAAHAGVDLVHSLGSTAPGWGRFRRVVTVHDLIYARFPEAHGGLRALGMRALVPLAVRRSDRVITDSQSTRRDLVELLGASPERIDVVPLGLGTACRDAPLPEAEVRARFGLGDRCVALSLSAKRPHKNLAALIGALARIRAEARPLLVLPGYPTWYERELRERASNAGVGADVRFLGWVSGAELEGLWVITDAFVFPSLYEGFGLPVLEAMARGVPVACSRAASLPEVAGAAALLFDPRDEAAIASALERLLSDPAEAERLRVAGRARAAQFTWERTARLTLESYARALGLRRTPESWREPGLGGERQARGEEREGSARPSR
jgi:glycosyltransferase involved in cell wall biosynthesis